jgi:hypothetical protein
MRTTIILTILYVLLGRVQAQTSINPTNRVTVAEAVKIASGLKVGMKEDDADEYLRIHGISGRVYDTNGAVLIYRTSVGDNFFWTTFYPLKEEFGLGLDYSNAYTTTNSLERNGVLQGAEISSNSVDIISITLTNSR